MKNAILFFLCIFAVCALSGCVKTYTYQVDRHDQDLVGNKGVVQGEAPPDVTGRTRTRTMGGIDVEMPPSEIYKQRKEAMDKGWMEPAQEPVDRKVKKITSVTEEEEWSPDVIEDADDTPAAAKKTEPVSTGYSDKQWVKEPGYDDTTPEEDMTIEPEPVREIPPPVEPKKEKAKAVIYTIQEGDTLGKVAKKFLGDASKWPDIYEANKNVIKEPSRIYPGQVIVIPENMMQAEEPEVVEDVK